jgi:hypothetical protein
VLLRHACIPISPHPHGPYYEGSSIVLKGLGHVPRPRNFAVANKFAPEDFLAKCHRHFSPSRLTARASFGTRVYQFHHIPSSSHAPLPCFALNSKSFGLWLWPSSKICEQDNYLSRKFSFEHLAAKEQKNRGILLDFWQKYQLIVALPHLYQFGCYLSSSECKYYITWPVEKFMP